MLCLIRFRGVPKPEAIPVLIALYRNILIGSSSGKNPWELTAEEFQQWSCLGRLAKAPGSTQIPIGMDHEEPLDQYIPAHWVDPLCEWPETWDFLCPVNECDALYRFVEALPDFVKSAETCEVAFEGYATPAIYALQEDRMVLITPATDALV